jgi:hypothetical protein
MIEPSSIVSAEDEVVSALAEGADRFAVYRAVQAALGGLVGHRLFTLLVLLPGGEEVQRFWSSDEKAYPLTGRKRVGPTPWGERVLRNRQCYLGRDAAGIRWAFADHELIASLGLASVVNVPIVHHGTALGTMNLLDVEGHYDDGSVAVSRRFAAYLIPAFLAEREAAEKA